jgi:hypothetical protein
VKTPILVSIRMSLSAIIIADETGEFLQKTVLRSLKDATFHQQSKGTGR